MVANRNIAPPRAVYATYEDFVREHAGPDATLGWIYFIGPEGGPVKIGYTNNVDERLRSLQTGNHQELHLWLVLRGTMAFEKGWHRRFADSRVRGEWFAVTPDLILALKENRSFAPKGSILTEIERLGV